MRTPHVILLFLSLIFFSCNPQQGTHSEMREAWVPVYSVNVTGVKAISAGPARPTVNAGKIYTIGNIIYQVEQDSGIHVINATNPAVPQKLGFIRSFLCKELSVKNGLIYTNNLGDLVVINATDPSNVREVARTPGVFPDLSLQYPPRPTGSPTVFFECPDPNKGIVVRWELKNIDNAKCWR